MLAALSLFELTWFGAMLVIAGGVLLGLLSYQALRALLGIGKEDHQWRWLVVRLLEELAGIESVEKVADEMGSRRLADRTLRDRR